MHETARARTVTGYNVVLALIYSRAAISRRLMYWRAVYSAASGPRAELWEISFVRKRVVMLPLRYRTREKDAAFAGDAIVPL